MADVVWVIPDWMKPLLLSINRGCIKIAELDEKMILQAMNKSIYDPSMTKIEWGIRGQVMMLIKLHELKLLRDVE